MEVNERIIERASGRLRGTNGTLILTNRRILFEHGSGLITKQTYTVLDLPLLAIKDVKIEKGFSKTKLVLIAQGEGYSGLPRIEIEVFPAENWGSALSSQIASRRMEIEEEKRKSRIQYVVDFSFLKAQMERGGISLQSIKCPSCGANVQMPEQGSYFKCAYCSNLIQSQDVFDRMKGLLGSL